MGKEDRHWTERLDNLHGATLAWPASILTIVVSLLGLYTYYYPSPQSSNVNENVPVNQSSQIRQTPSPEHTPSIVPKQVSVPRPTPTLVETPAVSTSQITKPSITIPVPKTQLIQFGETLQTQEIPMHEPFIEYRFRVNSQHANGSKIYITIEPENGFEPDIFLLNPDRNGFNVDIDRNTSGLVATFALKFEGEYFIRVGRRRGSGRFNISLN